MDKSAIGALWLQEKVRKEREDRMRNALEILASSERKVGETMRAHESFVRRVAREGLGRETE